MKAAWFRKEWLLTSVKVPPRSMAMRMPRTGSDSEPITQVLTQRQIDKNEKCQSRADLLNCGAMEKSAREGIIASITLHSILASLNFIHLCYGRSGPSGRTVDTPTMVMIALFAAVELRVALPKCECGAGPGPADRSWMPIVLSGCRVVHYQSRPSALLN